jgi:hypothetical protein
MRSLRLRPTLLATLAALATFAAPAALAQPALRPEDGLPPLLGARVVRFEDDWTGRGPVLQRARHVELRREGESPTFRGTAELRAHGTAGGDMRTVALAPSDSAMVAFLQALSAVPVQAGPPEDAPLAMDSNPRVAIRLEFGDGSVEFLSTSNQPGGAPWTVTLAGRGWRMVWVSDSDAPRRALDLLDAHTARADLERLVRDVARAAPR